MEQMGKHYDRTHRDMGQWKEEMEQKMKQWKEEIKRHFDVVAENIKHDFLLCVWSNTSASRHSRKNTLSHGEMAG